MYYMNKDYYVYEYWRLDNNTCFYVGKGKGDRCFQLNRSRSEHFNHILNKVSCAVYIVEDNLTEKEAHQTESFLIHDYVFNLGYGHKIGGNYYNSNSPYLVNATWGGDGSSGYKFTKEQRERLSKTMKGKTLGYKHSDETKLKISLANKGNTCWCKGKHLSEETKEKLRKANIGKKYSDEVNKKKGRPGRLVSEDTRKKISEIKTGKKRTNLNQFGGKNPYAKKSIIIYENITYKADTKKALIELFYSSLGIKGVQAWFKGEHKIPKKYKDKVSFIKIGEKIVYEESEKNKE